MGKKINFYQPSTNKFLSTINQFTVFFLKIIRKNRFFILRTKSIENFKSNES